MSYVQLSKSICSDCSYIVHRTSSNMITAFRFQAHMLAFVSLYLQPSSH